MYCDVKFSERKTESPESFGSVYFYNVYIDFQAIVPPPIPHQSYAAPPDTYPTPTIFFISMDTTHFAINMK